MKKNFYVALMACFVVVIIASILIVDNSLDVSNQAKTQKGYVDLDKEFVDKNFESIQASTGQDKNIEMAEAEKVEEAEVSKKIEVKQEFIWPIKGEIETNYSPNKVVYDKFLDQYTGEEEVSITANKDDDVVAAEEGTILKIFDGVVGKTIEIEHENGYVTTYSNVCDLKVEEDEFVEKNEALGKVNQLDGQYNFVKFGVKKDGKYIDPKKVVN
ncbi:MAG: hypothetical protein A2Y22_06840 [Clostridiales bacterium GWD2_32_59]|nr:MAG: hypothetical protein A2Y22_06840 [Clostridiales bacterium GWD2_32_59]